MNPNFDPNIRIFKLHNELIETVNQLSDSESQIFKLQILALFEITQIFKLKNFSPQKRSARIEQIVRILNKP